MISKRSVVPTFTEFIGEGYGDLTSDQLSGLRKLRDMHWYHDKKVLPEFTMINTETNVGWIVWGQIKAYDNKSGEEIANVSYGKESEDDDLMASVEVRKSWRRRGVATAIYKWIEELTGFTIHPSYPNSNDAKAFWNQPNRGFGPENI